MTIVKKKKEKRKHVSIELHLCQNNCDSSNTTQVYWLPVITVKIVGGFNQTVTVTKDQCHGILLIESYFIG